MLMTRMVVAMAAAAASVSFGVMDATPASAQAALLGPGAAYVGGGIARVGTAEVDERLDANGYPTFGQTATSIGIGAYRLLSSGVMIGIEGSPFFLGEETRSGRDVELGGGHATLGVGYAIPLSDRMRVYPRVGIGAGGIALEIESAADTIAFDDVLDAPTPAPIEQDPVLSRDGIVFDFGAGAEILSGGDDGALIGVRVGYLLAPWDDDWDLVYQGQASHGPDASISGVYLRVVVGGAWSR